MIKEMSPAEIEHLIANNFNGRLGCHADGVTYVVPIHYAYERGRVYGHTVLGKKISMMRKNPKVCLEVDRVDGLFDWESVIAWGTFRELEGDEARHALELLVLKLQRWAALHERVILEERMLRGPYIQGRTPVVYCIEITHSTGRCESP